MIPNMDTYELLVLFDRYLAKRHLHFEAVAIGGAALNLLRVVSRLTKDCDMSFVSAALVAWISSAPNCSPYAIGVLI